MVLLSAFSCMCIYLQTAEKTLAHRSRMDAVKQIFYAFGDRTATLSNAHGVHKLGLIKFDHQTHKMLDLTDEVRALVRLMIDSRDLEFCMAMRGRMRAK